MTEDYESATATHNLARLTRKQRDVLEQLAQHKTSKEISRVLGISPHTVDQRIDSARRLLGGASRRELVKAFVAYQNLCQQMTYEESPMAANRDGVEQSAAEEQGGPLLLITPQRTERSAVEPEVRTYRVLPELFDGKSGTLFRIVVIAIIAVTITLSMLAIMSIYLELSGYLKK